MSGSATIRPFQSQDAEAVRDLFISVNRLLSPPEMREAFEAYIARSLAEEVDRIEGYYQEHGGGFWVAIRDARLVGMFGLEAASGGAMELRRMYVDPSSRRGGIAWTMLQFAEAECRRLGVPRMELSTSELQPAAVALYRRAGYRLLRWVTARDASNKTIGSGILRFYFEKEL
jgi:putative acetyltransferase